MAIKCNICGGNAKYNIKTQRLECVHCGDAKVLGQFGNDAIIIYIPMKLAIPIPNG